MQEMFEQLHEDTERVQLPNDDATLSGEHEPDYDTAIAQTPHASSGNDGEGPVDASPGKQSELSRMERELGMVQAATRELDEQELIPDYGRGDLGGQVAPGEGGIQKLDAQTGGAQTAPVPAPDLMNQLGTLLQSTLQSNLLPMLDEVRMTQATVLSRLDKLENEQRLSAAGSEDPKERRAQSPGSSQRSVGPMRRPGSSHREVEAVGDHLAGIRLESRMAETAVMKHEHSEMGLFKGPSRFSDRGAEQVRERPPPESPEGVVMIEGVPHAWHWNAGVMVVDRLEARPESERRDRDDYGGEREKRVGSERVREEINQSPQASLTQVLHPRAQSPFAAIKQETSFDRRSRSASPSRTAFPRSLNRNSRSPKHTTHSTSTPKAVKSSPMQFGSPPSKPRIIKYPFSPGGTEIKPPPLPVSSTHTPEQMHPPIAPSAASSSHTTRDKYTPGDRVWWQVPALAEPKQNAATLAADWIAQVCVIMSDISPGSGEWFQIVLQEARDAYEQWAKAPAIERAQIRATPSVYLQDAKFARLEARVFSMLHASLPQSVKDELLAARTLNTVSALFLVLKTFQPGGLRERAQLLDALTKPGVGSTARDSVDKLRTWHRHLVRATSMGVAVPDPSILLRGLDDLVGPTMAKHPQVNFRCSMVRNRLALDHAPTHSGVLEFAQALQSEFSMLAVAGDEDSKEKPPKNPKLARMEEDTTAGAEKGGGVKGSKGKKGGDKGAKGSRVKPKCYHWLTAGGCKRGESCSFTHDMDELWKASDCRSRCFVCSAKGHMANLCPTKESGTGLKGGEKGHKGDAGKGASGQDKPVTKRVEEDTDKPKPAEGPGSTQADLLKGAEALLKALQTKALQMKPSLNRLTAQSSRTGLLDSGASTCLRRLARDEDETLLVSRTVELATGTAEMLINPFGTLLAREDVECIVALKPLISMGCKWEWSDDKCVLHHPHRGDIKLDTSSGCPRMPESLALDLIRDAEEAVTQKVVHALRAVQILHESAHLQVDEVLGKLVIAVNTGVEVAAYLGATARAMWPTLDEDVIQDLQRWPRQNSHAVRWNRRKRRAVVKTGGVLIQIGRCQEERAIKQYGAAIGWEILQVTEELNDPHDFRYLLEVVTSGKVRGMIAGDCGEADSLTALYTTLLMQINHVVEGEYPEVKPFSILVVPTARGLQSCCDQAGFQEVSQVPCWTPHGPNLLAKRARDITECCARKEGV